MGARGLTMIGLVLAGALQACGVGQSLDCTLVGGSNGVVLEIPESLFVTSGRVTFKVCDTAGCGTATRPLGTLPSDAPKPVERVPDASFEDLGRRFDPGPVTVTATLFGPRGHRVAARTAMVTLTRYYPNGKACDGKGYVSGGLELSAADRLR